MTILEALKQNKKPIGIVAALLVLLFGGIATFRIVRSHRAYAAAQEMFSERGGFGRMGAPEDREERREKFKEVMGQLSKEQRRELMQERGREMQKRQVDHAKEYTSLATEAEKNAFLDKDIERMQEGRKRAEASMKQNGFGGRGGNAQGPAGARGDSGRGGADGAGRFGSGRFGQAGAPPGSGRMKMSPEDSANRKMVRKDGMNAEDRQTMSAYRYDMKQRMKERGIVTPTAGRGGPGGGFGGGRFRGGF